jgi:biotin transport system substrate-specific component
VSASPAALMARPRVLADLLAGSRVRDVALIVAYAALTGLAAQVAIVLPFTPVPITGQTFVVLAGALALGWRRAGLGMALYLLVGLAGVPWYAQGHGGLGSLAAPSFGYVVGFIVAGIVTGWLAGRRFDRRPPGTVVAMIAGTVVIYAFGLPWLAFVLHVGPARALALGLYPFLIGDALKAALAAGVVPAAWWLVGTRK